MWLFVGDALTTLVFAAIVYAWVPETRPPDAEAVEKPRFSSLPRVLVDPRLAGFAVAQTLLATPTTLVVMLPPAAPAGGISFEYMNLSLQKVSGLTGCPRPGNEPTSTGDGPDAFDPRLGQVSDDLKELRVWRPLTALSVRASALGPDVAEVEAPERLCYLDAEGQVDESLRVFLDGRAVSRRASDALHVTCRPDDRNRLILLGVEPGSHLLQIATPFDLSPTVGFER